MDILVDEMSPETLGLVISMKRIICISRFSKKKNRCGVRSCILIAITKKIKKSKNNIVQKKMLS